MACELTHTQMTVLDSSAVGYSLDFTEIFNDSSRSRAILQNNEDKIEEFNKWSENMVRFVKTILEESSSKTFFKMNGLLENLFIEMAQMLPNLEAQINKFASFQDSFGKLSFFNFSD